MSWFRSLLLMCFAMSSCIPAAEGLSWEALDRYFEPGPDEIAVRAVFPFRNASERPVVISEVKACCGAQVDPLLKTIYRSGERGSIQVSLELGDRRGLMTKHITVIYRVMGGEEQRQRLAIKANIPRVIGIDRSVVYWRLPEDVQDGTLPTKSLTLTQLPDQQHRIVRIESADCDRFSLIALDDSGAVWDPAGQRPLARIDVTPDRAVLAMEPEAGSHHRVYQSFDLVTDHPGERYRSRRIRLMVFEPRPEEREP